MSEIKDKSAREKIVRARTNLIVSNGFFGFLAMQLRLVEATEHGGQAIDTMAVDGVSLFYNPKFVHGLTERETEGVLAHEIMHCCFQHFTRRQHRDPRGWNIAGDFVINNDLVDAGFTLPKGGLIDAKYKGMTTEDVYELLPKIIIKIAGGSGDGKGGEGSDPGGCGGVLDAPGDQNKADDLTRTWEVTVRAAVAVAKSNNAGQIPGSLKRLIDTLNKPKISWRDKTRNFIDQSMSKDISWARPSRRSAAIGVMLPGYISDRLNHLVFVADDSGSINMKLLTEFLSEVAGALDEGTADQMTVVYADTRVHHVDHFVPGDIVVPHELPNGGGGTDFRDSFRWIKENIPDASCVIYLTDLQVHEFGEDPGCPTLWAVYTNGDHFDTLAARAPFGYPIHVSNSVG